MKYILTLLLIVTYINASTSKVNTGFSLIIKKDFNQALFSVQENYDRTISAVGFSNHFEKAKTVKTSYTNPYDYLSDLTNSNGSEIELIKVDNGAKVKASKRLNLKKLNKAVSLVKTPNGGYIIGGYTLDGSIIVLKLDANLKILFSTIFGTKNYDKLHSLVLLRDGGFLSVGVSMTTRSKYDNLFETGLGLNDIYLTRFSKDGQKLWSKKYGTIYDDVGIDATEAFDGSIIVVGKTMQKDKSRLSIMRIDENGDKIWLKEYDRNLSYITPQKIITLKDGRFLLSVTVSDALDLEQIRFIKFDIEKNIFLDLEVNTIYSSVLKDIKEFSNGNIMGVGYVQDTYNADGLVMLFNKNLKLLSQEHYGKNNRDMLESLTILHNSQVGAVGFCTSEDSQESNMWILKLNKDCSLAQVSTKAFDFYQLLLKTYKQEIDAKELSIKEDLTIEFMKKDLYFKVGEYKLTKSQKLFLTKFYKKLIPLIVKYKEIIATFEIAGYTSSEWVGVDFTNRYLKNEKLSMNRAYSTLEYIFKNQTKSIQQVLLEMLKSSSYSYSKIIKKDDREDKVKSRRVSFKILLK